MNEDEAIKKFRPPVKGKEFKKYWTRFIHSVTDRTNFSNGHLKNLEILCRSYVEYDMMTEVIEEVGFSYFSSGRYGDQRKTTPELIERKKIMEEIRQYTRLLGIILDKDQVIKPSTDAPEEKWN